MTDRSEIDAIRALLSSKPRPAGWAERRQRLDEVGSAWAVAEDVKHGAVDLDGVPGEWSIAPGSDESRVLMSSTVAATAQARLRATAAW